MDSSGLFRDRRTDGREFPRKLTSTQPQPYSQPEHEVEHGIEADPRMSAEEIVASLRFPSAHPGEETLIMPRQRTQDLCRHCSMPILLSEHSGHIAERLPERIPGTHPDVTDHRARNSADRPTTMTGRGPVHD